MVIANAIYLYFVHETNPYTAIMEDIHINWFHGYYAVYLADRPRYSDKQTTRLPFTTLM